MSAPGLFDQIFEAGTELLSKGPRKRTCFTRLILAHIEEVQYVVLTPNGDIEVENFNDPKILYCVRSQPERVVPLDMGRLSQDFDPLPEIDELEKLVEQAEGTAQEFLTAKQPAPSGPESAAEAGFQLVGTSSLPQSRILGPKPTDAAVSGSPAGSRDTPVSPAFKPPSGPVALSGGLKALSSAISGGPASATKTLPPEEKPCASSDEVRVLSVKYDRNNLRFREFRDAVNCLESLEFTDWPVLGPRTVLWVVQFMVHRSNTPLGWHQEWKNLGRLSDSESLVLEHEMICRALEVGLCYDQLQVSALAAFEIIARQLQIVEDRLAYKFDNDAQETAHDYHIMSGFKHRAALCICPELRTYIATEHSKESAILKERRKAREERSLAHPKKAPKGASRGGGDG